MRRTSALTDAKGGKIAELLIGLNADVDNVGDKAQVYVRAPGDNQVWLTRGEGISTVSANPDEWLEKSIIDLGKDRVSRVDVKPDGSAPYAIVHAKPGDAAFVVEGQPSLKVKASSVDAVADGLAGLQLRDVARQDRIAFTDVSPSATYRTTDGLIVRIDVAKLGEDYWARLNASPADGADEKAKAEVQSLNRRLAPWVYEIERWKGEQIVGALSSLQDAPPQQVAPKPEDANPPGATPEPSAPSTVPAPTHQNAQKPVGKAPNKKPGKHR